MKNPSALTLRAACLWLGARPLLRADAATLITVVRDLVRICRPGTPEQAREVGEMAARECSRLVELPTVKHVWNGRLIEPGDLLD